MTDHERITSIEEQITQWQREDQAELDSLSPEQQARVRAINASYGDSFGRLKRNAGAFPKDWKLQSAREAEETGY